MSNTPTNRLGENLWKIWFKDSVIVGSDPYFIKKDEFIAELAKLISKREIEARKEELKSLESNMISSDSQWFAIGERIAQLKQNIKEVK